MRVLPGGVMWILELNPELFLMNEWVIGCENQNLKFKSGLKIKITIFFKTVIL